MYKILKVLSKMNEWNEWMKKLINNWMNIMYIINNLRKLLM